MMAWVVSRFLIAMRDVRESEIIRYWSADRVASRSKISYRYRQMASRLALKINGACETISLARYSMELGR